VIFAHAISRVRFLTLPMPGAARLSRIGRKKIRFFIAKINQKDLVVLKDLMEAGKVAPVIDRRYPLSDAAEALRYLAEGHAKGKIVITIAHSDDT
jgi:NADPH:quinone reductase-like Zn-dependent oxidoreductase